MAGPLHVGLRNTATDGFVDEFASGVAVADRPLAAKWPNSAAPINTIAV